MLLLCYLELLGAPIHNVYTLALAHPGVLVQVVPCTQLPKVWTSETQFLAVRLGGMVNCSGYDKSVDSELY